MCNTSEVNIQVCQQRLELEFRDIDVVRQGKHGLPPKQILKGVKGRFRPGRLTAILGPSGAGKTSLLNALTGFCTVGVKGSIKINGKERILQTFRKECCYITQDCAMLGLMTVKETFKSTSDLKLGRKINDEKKFSVISEIAGILNLSSCMDTQVRYLSGGEKKRLCIGLELITNPPIMFFDEPTSGLDSSSSFQVISHLKVLSRGGRTIVCVIHQPSSRIFEMFDDVYIIVDSQCLYSGTVDDMVPFLKSAGFICPKYYNRADFAIEVASKERGNIEGLFSLAQRSSTAFGNDVENNVKKESRSNENITAFINEQESMQPMLRQEKNCKNTIIQIVPTDQPNQLSVKNYQKPKVTKYPTSTWLQFCVLLKRTFLCTCVRDLHIAQIRFIVHVVVGLLMGAVFYNFGNDAGKATSNASFIFFSIMFIFFSNSVPTVVSYPSEAAVFIREHLNNWYSMKAYYFSKLVADLPLQILCPTAYYLISYFMTDQPLSWDRVGMVLLLGFLATTMSQALGHAFGAAFDAQAGTFLITATSIPMTLFCGFFILFRDLSPWLRWMYHISYFTYIFEGFIIAIYGNDRPNLKCSISYCQHKYPSKFLRDLDFADGNYWIDVFGIVIWIVIFRLAFYCILKWKLYRIRGY